MDNTYKCPVCGMEVTPSTAAGKSEYDGQTYYFCSKADKQAFDQNPEKYIGSPEHNPS